MTKYAPYILGSYGLAAICMCLLLCWVKQARRRTLKRLEQWFKREIDTCTR